MTIDLAAEIGRLFDDSSLVTGRPPALALILGPVAVGKTHHRRDKFSRGYVVLDAGDIFINLSHGESIDFPSFLEEPMDSIGCAIARRAVLDGRNIVCELLGVDLEPTKNVIDTFLDLGYHVSIANVEADFAQSKMWNENRSDDNISAYYTEPYHRKWLLGAAAAHRSGEH